MPETASRPNLLLACDQRVRQNYLAAEDIERLERFADWDWFEAEGGSIYTTTPDESAAVELAARLGDTDGLIVCHGSPTINAPILEGAPRLKIIGELEGDRFASRIDLEAAGTRGIRTVDTTNGSSYPVAEWALALIIIALRNAGALFRRIIARDIASDRGAAGEVLVGKRVGLIGCGHMGRRLIKLLRPFEVEIWVHDPYLPAEVAEAVGMLQTSLHNVLSQCDVVVCAAPLPPRTQGMIGRAELELLRPGAALVNVSRGPIIDTEALIARLKRGDITAGLDVFDPEPIPADSEIIDLPNVFLTPHSAARIKDGGVQFFKLMVDEMERFFHGHQTLFDLTSQARANRSGSEPD